MNSSSCFRFPRNGPRSVVVEASVADSAGRRLALLRLGLLVAFLITCGVALVFVGVDNLSDALEAVSKIPWGVVGFIWVYIALVVAFAPGSFATITSAAIFGFGTGLLISMTGATIGASLAFIISRKVGRKGVEMLLGDRLQNVDKFIGEREFVSILVLRLLPVVPFNGLNYASGLTSVRFSRYFPATILGMLPGATLTSWTVSQAGDMTSSSFLVGIGVTAVAVVGSGILARRYVSGRSLDASA